MSDDKELYKTLGALLEGVKDIKDELKFMHNERTEDRRDIKDIDKRLQSVEKRQYTIIIAATAVWAGIVMLVRKYL